MRIRSTSAAPQGARQHVRPAGFVTRNLLNKSVAALASIGISLYGSRMLWVRGRSTGQWRRTPVNPLTLRGERFLVAPRGHVQWTKNLRAGGTGELRLGRRVERFTATEVADADKVDILRAYLRTWAFEVGVFFDGVGADSPDSELARISPRHPVFRITV
jgi:deazaflavin-dependent oxidoreductase (nitroreductase family)